MKWNILCYHTVDPNQAEVFIRQLNWFRECEGYKFQAFNEAFMAQSHGGHGKIMTVTFDDGDWTVSAIAQKVLDDEGIRAMLYLTPDYVLKKKCYRAKTVRPALNWDQLGRWIDAGHEIGSHTNTHINPQLCEMSEFIDELEQSRLIIQTRLGITPCHFAYPWGQHNEQTLQWFHGQSDWKTAALVQGRFNSAPTDPFLLHRNVMSADWDLQAMHRVVRGRIARWVYQVKTSLFRTNRQKRISC